MRSLARAKPEQAFVASSTLGYLPLHYAACNGAPLEVVQTIFEAHPAACVTKEKKGLTPAALADKMGHGTIARALERLWQQREGEGGLEGGGAGGAPGPEGGQGQAPRCQRRRRGWSASVNSTPQAFRNQGVVDPLGSL